MAKAPKQYDTEYVEDLVAAAKGAEDSLTIVRDALTKISKALIKVTKAVKYGKTAEALKQLDDLTEGVDHTVLNVNGMMLDIINPLKQLLKPHRRKKTS